MRYCIRYSKSSQFRHMEDINEIEIVYHREDLSLPEFIERYKNKTIVINYIDNLSELSVDVERLAILVKKYPNIKLKISYCPKYAKLLKDNKIPFFYSKIVYNWDELNSILEDEPTDIYIGYDFGFSIVNVAKKIHEKNIKVRCIPNLAQSLWDFENPITKFFIRPEDLSLYEDYIDICEFYGENDRQSVLYEIYAQDKKWDGGLNYLIAGFKDDTFNNADIDNPGFGMARLHCKKRCATTDKCKLCCTALELAKQLRKYKEISI